MGDTKLKPEAEQIRLIYTTEEPRCFASKYEGKVFAVIGPFEGFGDKLSLQKALKELLADFNKLHPKRKS